jgi:hypothetical protein
MNVAITVSCIPFSRLLITSVSSGLLTANVHTHASNFGRTAEFNLSNMEERISQGATLESTSNTSKSPNQSGNSKNIGTISLGDNRNSKSWDVPWKNVKHISHCSENDENGRSEINSLTTFE